MISTKVIINQGSRKGNEQVVGMKYQQWMLWSEVEGKQPKWRRFEANAFKFTWKFGTQNLTASHILTLR